MKYCKIIRKKVSFEEELCYTFSCKRSTIKVSAITTNNSGGAVMIITEINQNWKMKEVGVDAWVPAIVPGDLYSDLLRN